MDRKDVVIKSTTDLMAEIAYMYMHCSFYENGKVVEHNDISFYHCSFNKVLSFKVTFKYHSVDMSDKYIKVTVPIDRDIMRFNVPKFLETIKVKMLERTEENDS